MPPKSAAICATVRVTSIPVRYIERIGARSSGRIPSLPLHIPQDRGR